MDLTARPDGGPVDTARPGTTTVAATPDADPAAVVAELVNVSKAFGPTQALRDVSVQVRRGEVVALVGENGAGKSTCVKLLAGVYQPDGGEIRVQHRRVTMSGPADARGLGIAVVHQHPGLFTDLSITENLFAGKLRRRGRFVLDHAGMRRDAERALRRVGLRRDPATTVQALSTSEQQLVEIARALVEDTRVLILDEPTAALSAGEVDRLFDVVDVLRADGVAIVFVGHRLEEIERIADRVTILRDGQLVGAWPARELTRGEMVRRMVGRPLDDLYPERTGAPGPVVLQTRGLTRAGVFDDISLTVRAGEVVGLAGLVGSGRTELARVLFGVDHASAGEVLLDTRPVQLRSPAGALAHGIAYVSEDRRGQSVIEDFSILDNATLPVITRATRGRLLVRHLEMALVSGPLERMRLKFHDYDQPLGTLSGGNQQKVVLAKWLAAQPRVLILDEPTQGIDVQAKAEVHRIVAALADQGLAVLLISSDLPEVLGMSDRVLVMRQGRLVAELPRGQATQEAVALAATGTRDTDAPDSAPADRPPAAAATAPTVRQPAQASTPGRGSQLLAALLARREFGLLAVLALLVVGMSLTLPAFRSTTNLTSVSGEAALVGVVAVGEMLVLLTRNIDLSVGSVIGLTAYVFGTFAHDHPGLPIAVAVLVACGLGLACGLVNGAIVAYGRVPSIVVTLGTLYVYRGIDATLSNGKEVAPGDIPGSAQALLSRSVGGPTVLVWIALAVFAVVGVALRWTRAGREIYQVGSNPDGARLIGLPASRRVLVAFAASGLLAGVCGVLWAVHYGIVDGQSAYGLELSVVAAAVVGGIALRGGVGTAVGVLLGTLLLFTIQNALQLAKVESSTLQAFYGAAILLAVALDAAVTRRAARPRKVTA